MSTKKDIINKLRTILVPNDTIYFVILDSIKPTDEYSCVLFIIKDNKPIFLNKPVFELIGLDHKFNTIEDIVIFLGNELYPDGCDIIYTNSYDSLENANRVHIDSKDIFRSSPINQLQHLGIDLSKW